MSIRHHTEACLATGQASDSGLVNAQLPQPVSAANFLKDVNAYGALTAADKGIANANLTRALPAP
jgi:hypothetical protein